MAKEKATSRENLKKVMAITKEKKDVEQQLQAHVAAVAQLQASLQAVPQLQSELVSLRAKVTALEGELEEEKPGDVLVVENDRPSPRPRGGPSDRPGHWRSRPESVEGSPGSQGGGADRKGSSMWVRSRSTCSRFSGLCFR